MTRVEFNSFLEASEFSKKLSISIRSTTIVHRDGEIWWVDDPRVKRDNSDLSANPTVPSQKKQIYLFDKRGSLVSISDGDKILSSDQIVQASSKKAESSTIFLSDANRSSFKERLKHLQEYLNQHIIGQYEPVNSICRRVRISYSGLSPRSGPVAVFLCIGPSGVGKTEMAKTMAKYLMGGEEFLIRLDMSEYMEKHSVSKLIGSPPGYVGYDEEGQLTGKLRKNPRSVLLLDEVEKAHPRVMDMFLQLFGEGRITDSKGETVDAKEAIVVMTSNINIRENSRIGFTEGSRKVTEIQLDSLKNYFRTELVNRIDKVVIFNRLERDSIRRIIAPMLDEIRANFLKSYGAKLSISDELIELLINEGCNLEFGARELKRTVEHLLLGGLSELMTREEIKAGNTVTAYMTDTNIAFSLDKSQIAKKPSEMFHTENVSVSQNTNQCLTVGIKVRHSKFGDGTVRKIDGSGDNQKVTVWFNSVGPKKLLTRFAGLVQI